MKSSMWKWGLAIWAVTAIPLTMAAYDNSPSGSQTLPEVIWAAAYGGGTWVTEIQIVDMTGGSQVMVNFYYGAGNYRGPALLWTGTQYHSIKFSNILGTLQSMDAGFNYYGKVGALALFTQDVEHKIQVTARTVNGNYSKTFPGLGPGGSNSADYGRDMMIMDLVQNQQYRSTVGFFNPGETMTAWFLLLDADANAIGSIFSKTFVTRDFQAFYPFAEAGVPSGTYDNCWLLVHPVTIDGGELFCFGATANNYTNDPAAHVPKQFQ